MRAQRLGVVCCLLARTIDVLSVSNRDDAYDQIRVAHLIDDPIVALAYAVMVATRKLLTARWSRFIGKGLNPTNEPLPIFLCCESLEFFYRRGLDQNSIFSHCV